MEKIIYACDKLYSLSSIPVSLVSPTQGLLMSRPDMQESFLSPEATELVLTDFELQRRDELHPLISFVEPGFFLGVCKFSPELYAVIGLVSPTPHTRREILTMCSSVMSPEGLQRYCDMVMRQPTVSLEQVRDIIGLLVQLVHGVCLSREDIHFEDVYLNRSASARGLEQELFKSRENIDPHVPVDFETALCSAIRHGSRDELLRLFYSPVEGRVGTMSFDPLTQLKYSAVSLATLVSRAAIEGGLPAETSFSMSDLFCQRMDILTDESAVQELTVNTLFAYCDKVKEFRTRSSASETVQKCMDYISVHLHERIGLEELSEHVGLCSRSLSLRFRRETNMSIPDYIHSERMREAEFLLLHTDHTLSEISSFLSYPSQSYFTRIFRKFRGTTPQQYREGRAARE